SRLTIGLPVLLSGLMLLSGCLEVETTTEVRRDGSFVRTVTVKGDSSDILIGGDGLSLDSTWGTTFEKVGDKKHLLTASREFQDIVSMNDALRGEDDLTIRSRAELEEEFLWFFTTYRYREVYETFNPYVRIPITDYVSPTELDLWLRHHIYEEPYRFKGDSLSVDDASDRYEEWYARSFFESYYGIFLKGVELLGDASLTREDVESKKEELFQAVYERSPEPKRALIVGEVFQEVLHTERVQAAIKANAAEFEDLELREEFESRVFRNDYKAHVVMPGLITDTNAPTVEGNKASWSKFMTSCYFGEHEIWVESRVVNWWAIILTGGIILIGVALYAFGILRRRAA
ncbi:MAG: hypothetical protein WBD30_06835, partial [Bacteroidota bacterium]